MNFDLQGGTDRQRDWFMDAIAASAFPFDDVTHDVTVQWSDDPNPDSPIEEAWTWNNTQTNSLIIIRNGIERRGKSYYMTLVNHEMAHILMAHFTEEHVALATDIFSPSSWEPVNTSLAAWKASALEATAETFKDVFLGKHRAWSNVTRRQLPRSRFDDFLRLWCPSGGGGGGGGSTFILPKSGAFAGGMVGGAWSDGFTGDPLWFFHGAFGWMPPVWYDNITQMELVFTAAHQGVNGTPEPGRVAEWASNENAEIYAQIEINDQWPDMEYAVLIDESHAEETRWVLPESVHTAWDLDLYFDAGRNVGGPFGTNWGWPAVSWYGEFEMGGWLTAEVVMPSFHIVVTTLDGGGGDWGLPDDPCHDVPWPYKKKPTPGNPGRGSRPIPPKKKRIVAHRVAATRGRSGAIEFK